MSTAPDRIIVPRRRAEKLNEDYDVAATITLSPPGPQDGTEVEYLLATPEREAAGEAQGVLGGLVERCLRYMRAHDEHGGDSIEAGRAWVRMRRAADKGRELLAKIEVAQDAEELAAARGEGGDG